ncbi:MAG TPA: restriction endonuclease subunit S [Candidatus Acidoferrales bacterium]|nr:restriction endonuclease subunit S [Candidatus Acidoferrales bacterium]
MTADVLEFPKAFAVWFKELSRWDASSFHRIKWHWPNHVMAPIGSALRLRKERVDKKSVNFADLQPITIHFDGSVDKRVVDANREYSMDLWFARPGDIVVAKIDLKNGAVGIVPNDWKNVVVTGHFAVYEPDRSKLLPEYLHRIIQANFFRDHLWRNKVGAEGRKEVKLDFFEQEHVPLPPLAEQRAIVARWQQAQDEIIAASRRVEHRRSTIESRVFADLGLVYPEQLCLPKALGVWWQDFSRWGARFNQLRQAGADITQGTFPVVSLDSLLEVVQYGTSEKANTDGRGVPVLRIGNIKNGGLDLSELKHIVLPPKTVEGLLLKDGDVLIIRTSGSRDLVGTCAVFHGTGDFVFASYLIRLRFDLSEVVPDFVSWFLNCPLGRQQVDAVSRQIMQSNINSEELRALEIPLPPLAVQKEIMARVSTGHAEIAKEQEAAAVTARQINTEVEALILGTKSVSDL